MIFFKTLLLRRLANFPHLGYNRRMAINFDISKLELDSLAKQREELRNIIFSDPHSPLWDTIKILDAIILKLEY